tara:strand:+ start:403 stop:666 length:264 start_codon:yes stop_codon:yes gene_type:complete
MSQKDAYMFPIIGSGVLFGLYVLFKFFSKEYINYLLTTYFLLFGIGMYVKDEVVVAAKLVIFSCYVVGENRIFFSHSISVFLQVPCL